MPPRKSLSAPHRLSIQKRFHVTAAQNAEMEDIAHLTGQDEAAVLRAAWALAEPLLRTRPGLVALLQPGVLATSPD